MPVAHTGYRALPWAARRALNLMVSKYSRNQADNETWYSHSLPCPAPSAAKACSSSHKRCTIETFSLARSLPLILLFLPGPRSASRQRRGANLTPKPGQRALTLYARASPLVRLTHSFGARNIHQLQHFFISSTFFPFLHSALSLHYSLSPQKSLLFRACNKNTNHLRCIYLHCYPSSSISCSTPTRSFILELLFRAFSCCLSLSHTLSLTHQDLNLNIHCQTCEYTTFSFNPLLLCSLFFSILYLFYLLKAKAYTYFFLCSLHKHYNSCRC